MSGYFEILIYMSVLLGCITVHNGENMTRRTITFDEEDEELLDRVIKEKRFDSYSDAVRQAVRETFGQKNKEETK